LPQKPQREPASSPAEYFPLALGALDKENEDNDLEAYS
jgi:hypothetical protein